MDQANRTKVRDKTGMVLGAIAGLVFAFGAWGIDAVQLYAAHAVLPWVKFLAGLLCAVFLGSLCGFLTARSSNILVIILLWVIWGGIVSWVASQLPFEYLSSWVARSFPSLAGEIRYPMPAYYERRVFLSWLISFGLTFLFSLPFSNLVDQVTANVHTGSSVVSVLITSALIFGLGLSIDSLYNKPFRSALEGTNDAIQLALQHPEALESGKLSNQYGLLGVRTMRAYLDQSYILLVESYDQTIESVQVRVMFETGSFSCACSNNLIYMCTPE